MIESNDPALVSQVIAGVKVKPHEAYIKWLLTKLRAERKDPEVERKSGTEYSAVEITLLHVYAGNISVAEIANLISRTVPSVYYQLKKRGLPCSTKVVK